MRRLSLILSDFYLPAEVDAAAFAKNPLAARELPALEWLLRYADSQERVVDWRRWLLSVTNPGVKDLPIAAISADGHIGDSNPDSIWLATPVALEVRLDHVRLLDRGLLRLDESERTGLREEFARVFGPEYQLHDGGERGFFLSGLSPIAKSMTDPARLIGSEIGPALPDRDAVELRRLWAELEMWLHGAEINTARDRARKARVSALWLWGAQSSVALKAFAAIAADVTFYGGDPLVTALARRSSNFPKRAPHKWDEIGADASHVIAEFATITGEPHEALEALDANWFAPVKEALVTGEMVELDILANDRHFHVSRRPHRRFWRRGKKWLPQLGFAANEPHNRGT